MTRDASAPTPSAGLRLDVVAGLTAAAVVLPKAIAYATVAALPAAVGLYTAFVPMLIYALLGSSRVLSVSSTATLAILTGAQLGAVVPDGDPARLAVATATLSALVGLLLVAARLLRLGFVANFISMPVLTGFKSGIGAVIVLDQIPKLLGVHIAKQGFFRDALAIVQLISGGSRAALLPGALGIALMSFTESIAAARAFAATDDPPIDAARELLAVGAANLGGALLGAMPAGGGTSQTAVVRAVGARTQKASLVTAAAALATMLLLAPLLAALPDPALAAIVIVYSVGLVEPAEFLAILRVRRMEFLWAVAAALGVLVFGTLQGIVAAIVLSTVGLASQTAHPRVSVIGRKRGADVLRPLSHEHADDEVFEGLLIVRPKGRLYFVNALDVAERLDALVARHAPRVLAIDLSRVPDVEYSALQMLAQLDRRMAERGVTVWLAALNPGVVEAVRNAGLQAQFGAQRLLFNAREAIARFQSQAAADGGR